LGRSYASQRDVREWILLCGAPKIRNALRHAKFNSAPPANESEYNEVVQVLG